MEPPAAGRGTQCHHQHPYCRQRTRRPARLSEARSRVGDREDTTAAEPQWRREQWHVMRYSSWWYEQASDTLTTYTADWCESARALTVQRAVVRIRRPRHNGGTRGRRYEAGTVLAVPAEVAKAGTELATNVTRVSPRREARAARSSDVQRRLRYGGMSYRGGCTEYELVAVATAGSGVQCLTVVHCQSVGALPHPPCVLCALAPLHAVSSDGRTDTAPSARSALHAYGCHTAVSGRCQRTCQCVRVD